MAAMRSFIAAWCSCLRAARDDDAHFAREVGRNDAAAHSTTGELGGVADGTRTHDNRNHNPGLYQLSYSHHWNIRRSTDAINHQTRGVWPARQESNPQPTA